MVHFFIIANWLHCPIRRFWHKLQQTIIGEEFRTQFHLSPFIRHDSGSFIDDDFPFSFEIIETGSRRGSDFDFAIDVFTREKFLFAIVSIREGN